MHRLPEERLSVLRAVVGEAKNISILMAQVDPDALASACLMSAVLKHLGKKASDIKLFYGGHVGHPQNRTLVNRFGLAILPMSKFTEVDAKGVVLVDSFQTDDARLGTTIKFSPIVIIDHHRGNTLQPSDKQFVWIEDVGAASTLLVELAHAVGLEMPAGVESYLPLLLAVGIHTDTNGLIHATQRDMHAYAQMSAISGQQELARCFNYPIPPAHFTMEASALNNRKVQNARLVTSVGMVQNGDGDVISTIADRLIRCDGVSLVVVWGIVDGKKVRIAARNTDISRDLGSFLQTRLNSQHFGAKLTEDGLGIGGGQLDIPLGEFWIVPETADEVISVVRKRIETAIFRD